MRTEKPKTTKIALKDIKTDPVGDMLVKGEQLKPYLSYYTAVLLGQNSNVPLEALAALPNEQRYLSRVVQCLDWALADFDDETVKLDMPYMPDLHEIEKKLRLRLWQLSALIGTLRGRMTQKHYERR